MDCLPSLFLSGSKTRGKGESLSVQGTPELVYRLRAYSVELRNLGLAEHSQLRQPPETSRKQRTARRLGQLRREIAFLASVIREHLRSRLHRVLLVCENG
jgi:hypothetical protein